mmetsp:Transcript_112628/g.257984  ORF Transcript_112628/g.257984 Transcript_112628/m.257984 type:complete len:224 (-) Transcript_112628:162-833(-)
MPFAVPRLEACDPPHAPFPEPTAAVYLRLRPSWSDNGVGARLYSSMECLPCHFAKSPLGVELLAAAETVCRLAPNHIAASEAPSPVGSDEDDGPMPVPLSPQACASEARDGAHLTSATSSAPTTGALSSVACCGRWSEPQTSGLTTDTSAAAPARSSPTRLRAGLSHPGKDAAHEALPSPAVAGGEQETTAPAPIATVPRCRPMRSALLGTAQTPSPALGLVE